MSPSPDADLSPLAKRYATRRRELEAATAEKVTTAAEAGRALALAGALLRRSELVGDAARDALLAVDRVEARAAAAYVASVDAAAEHAKLARGLDDAFEGLLAGDEDPDERALYTESAEAALDARDALASVRAALVCAGADTAPLDDKLVAIDASLVAKARLLVGLNPARRREAAALDPAEREAAWWFSARSQCDFLAGLYRQGEADARGQSQATQPHKNAAHLAVCEDCQRDVEASSLAYTPQHVTASSLWRRERGEATPAELAFMDAHGKTCKDCRRALDALAVPEE